MHLFYLFCSCIYVKSIENAEELYIRGFFSFFILFFLTFKNEEELCIRVCFSFFLFIFHAKSGDAISHRRELSEISN